MRLAPPKSPFLRQHQWNSGRIVERNVAISGHRRTDDIRTLTRATLTRENASAKPLTLAAKVISSDGTDHDNNNELLATPIVVNTGNS